MSTHERDDDGGPGTRILCVDDEDLVGGVVTKILESHLDCRVVYAESGREALRRIDESTFDALVLDYVMPAMDGGELFRCITRRRPELEDRTLFITGDTLRARTIEGIRETGRPYLHKPFGMQELTDAVRRLLPGTSVDAVVAQPLRR